MGLNIKNETAHRLAQELSRLTGETLTDTVTHALQERLNQLRSPAQQHTLADELLAIGEDCASRLKEPYKSIDHGDLLYDEFGLPK
jgi:antitoxin VapB